MKAPKRSLATVSAQVEALTADQPKMWSQVTAMTATLASMQAVGPEQVMMQSLASNTKALTMLLEGQGDKKKKKEKKDRGIDESSSDGSDSSGSDEGGRLRGSSSALGMSRLRTWVSKKPLRVRRLLLRRLSSLLGVKPSEFRARSYLETFACFKDHKTLAMLEWMLGGIIDSFMAGRQDQGFAELLLLFVSIEQTCIDGGKWQNSFLLSCSREVPWGLLLREETPQAASRRVGSQRSPAGERTRTGSRNEPGGRDEGARGREERRGIQVVYQGPGGFPLEG